MVAADDKQPPVAWSDLLGLIPGYDPFAGADAFFFDPESAQRALDFFPTFLKHVKGPIAGEPFELEQWQRAVIANLFGWKDRRTGLRRYCEVWVYVAKKNGKSAFAAGIVLYVLVSADEGEQGAELYSAAASREQAGVVFSHVAGMIRQESELSSRLRIYGDRGGSVCRSVVYPAQMASYKCLAADANRADGVNPALNVIDEVHRHRTSELADVLVKSTGAQAQPITIYLTTADYNRPSLCNTLLKYARDVRDNGGDPVKAGYDPHFLPAIYEADKDDDWEDKATWHKANPCLGITVTEKFLEHEAAKARERPSELNNFLRLHLNIVTDADEAWLPMEKWDECDTAVDPDELSGQACYAGLDLASTRDVSALVLYFPADGSSGRSKAAVLPYFWVPAEGAHQRERCDRVSYGTWAREGFIELTLGDVVDYDVIRRRINEIGELFNIREIAIDRWNSTQLQTQLIGDGFEVVPFGQGYSSMTAPTKELERQVVSGALAHGGNPVLRWMASNVSVEMDAAGNLKPKKKKKTSEKTDGIVSLIMAIGQTLVAEEKKPSVYSTRGVMTI